MKQKLEYQIKTYHHFTLIFFIILFFNLSCSEEKKISKQQAYITPETMCGTVQFKDGCSPKLDTLISFGIALIHHMTYDEAEYIFNQVIEADKDCFWGYWGKAMSYIHPLWPDTPGEKQLKEGYALTQNALNLAETDKEKLYGNAIASFYKGGLNRTKGERLGAFYESWNAAQDGLPDDLEAKLFYALAMLSTVSPNDKSYKVQKEAGAIAEKTLEKIPDHPGGFHYAIHAYDFPPLASNAIRVAKNYYKIAPELPHALHMPTHIFTRLGYWQESIDLNLRSANAALKLPANNLISNHYFHALDYLVYAYLQKSEYEKAKEIAVVFDTLKSGFQEAPQTAYSIAAISGRIALEYQQWRDAANLSLHNYKNLNWEKFPQYEALVYFAKGIGAGRSGNIEIAMQSLRKLNELQKSFYDTVTNKYWINQIEIQKRVVQSWLLYAQNRTDNALKEMFAAAGLEDATEKNPVTPGQLLPAREMLGDMLLELNRPKDALEQYERSLEKLPNRFNSLFGAGKSAELSGDKKKASYYYKKITKISDSKGSKRDRLLYAVNSMNKI